MALHKFDARNHVSPIKTIIGYQRITTKTKQSQIKQTEVMKQRKKESKGGMA